MCCRAHQRRQHHRRKRSSQHLEKGTADRIPNGPHEHNNDASYKNCFQLAVLGRVLETPEGVHVRATKNAFHIDACKFISIKDLPLAYCSRTFSPLAADECNPERRLKRHVSKKLCLFRTITIIITIHHATFMERVNSKHERNAFLGYLSARIIAEGCS